MSNINPVMKSYVDRWLDLLNQQEALREDMKELTTEIKVSGNDAASLKRFAQLVGDTGKARKVRALNQTMLALARVTGYAVDLGTVEMDGEHAEASENRAVRAAELLAAGTSQRHVAEQTGMSKSAVGRLAKALASAPPHEAGTKRGGAVPHDPETGEITESSAPPSAAPTMAAEPADRDGGASTPSAAGKTDRGGGESRPPVPSSSPADTAADPPRHRVLSPTAAAIAADFPTMPDYLRRTRTA